VPKTPSGGRHSGRSGDEESGLGIRSTVSHRLHPTAQKILAAAKTILTERGYREMTLQAISAEAQVNKAGVWYYFGGKQQLVLALFEDIAVRESHHFGTLPPPGATLAERVELIVGSAGQVQDRVRRFSAFYELLPEASRDAVLHEHMAAYYRRWYEWAQEVLSPAAASPDAAARPTTRGQFASVLLDGIFLQMAVDAPGFDLQAALDHARQALLHLMATEAGERPDRAATG